MRRIIAMSLVMSVMIMTCGCGSSSEETYPSMTAYNAVPGVYETAVTMPSQPQPVTAEMAFVNGENGIDIDLTVLSSTMVYSFVYCMVTTPEEYRGMVVKMSGVSASSHNEETGMDYYGCIIQDATACCSQGIEYELQGEYPEDGEMICVTGTFDTYEEGGYTYCILREAELS